jgi:polar amino acid transport system substrate-binding protein
MLRRTKMLARALAPAISSGADASESPKQITIAIEGAHPSWNFVKPDGSVASYEIDIIDACPKEYLS